MKTNFNGARAHQVGRTGIFQQVYRVSDTICHTFTHLASSCGNEANRPLIHRARGRAFMRSGCVVAALVLAGFSRAEVTLPAIFSDHMVLQRDAAAPVWGWAAPGEVVSVSLNGQVVRTTTGPDGRWSVSLNLERSPRGPFEMVVAGRNRRQISDVVVGEVWLASGQSNMEVTMMSQINAKEEVATAQNLWLRQFWVEYNAGLHTAQDCRGFWMVCEPGTAGYFSAVGYYFGKEIQERVGVPVGLIKASWGGKRIEPFISAAGSAGVPKLAAEAAATNQRVERNVAAFRAWLRDSGREDRPVADDASHATGPTSATEGWLHVNDVGDIGAAALPRFGALWFRKDVESLPTELDRPQILLIGLWAMFYRVYVNGELIGVVSLDNNIGYKKMNQLLIPARLWRNGVNSIAVRVFAPSQPAGFSFEPQLGSRKLRGGWRAKSEFSLPPVPPDQPAPSLTPTFAAAGSTFNRMIHPLVPYAMRGVIWYQGESNVMNAHDYRSSFPALIADWRGHWKQPVMPFYFCQLANYDPKVTTPGESPWAELREAQAMALADANTGMAVLIDTGEAGDIHPQTKDIAGQRLAALALAKTYGESIPFSGPLYESMTTEGARIRIRFKHIEGGLVAREVPPSYPVMRVKNQSASTVRNSPHSQLEGFAICGWDKKWVWADAKIDGETVLVSSPKVPAPIAVRYAWSDNPTVNLYNAADLPAQPFRTDTDTPKTHP